MTSDPTPATASAAALVRSLGYVHELPELYPLHGVAAALVVERNGAEHVRPIIVIDFYREHGQP